MKLLPSDDIDRAGACEKVTGLLPRLRARLPTFEAAVPTRFTVAPEPPLIDREFAEMVGIPLISLAVTACGIRRGDTGKMMEVNTQLLPPTFSFTSEAVILAVPDPLMLFAPTITTPLFIA